MSAILDIYNDIVTELEKIEDKGKRVIQTVGLWNEQFDNEELEKAFSYPAVFIEFSTIRWDVSDISIVKTGLTGNIKGQQKGDPEEPSLISLHIGFEKLKDVSKSFPEILQVTQAVYFALQAKQGEFYSPLLRIEETQDADHDRVIDWIMDFETTLFQCGEEDSTLVKIAPGTLTIDINLDLDIDDLRIRSGDGET